MPSKIYPNWDFWFENKHLATLFSRDFLHSAKRHSFNECTLLTEALAGYSLPTIFKFAK
jgi:hypothetical protein